jgi:hypothetical protein
MENESPYLEALVEINSDHFNEKKWLITNFELYKSTLNWPVNLPPINRSNLNVGTLQEKFNATFQEILLEFEFQEDNENQTLILNNRLDDLVI